MAVGTIENCTNFIAVTFINKKVTISTSKMKETITTTKTNNHYKKNYCHEKTKSIITIKKIITSVKIYYHDIPLGLSVE